MEREEALQTLALLQRVVAQARDDTTLQNWGLIWIVHGFTNGGGFCATNAMLDHGIASPWAYVALWCGILAFNFPIIFLLKRRTAGARTFIESQIWNIWLGYIASVALTGLVNQLGGWTLFALGPIIAVLSSFAFLMMGAVIGGRWVAMAGVFAFVAILMAMFPERQFYLLGVVWTICQVGGGIKMHRARLRREARAEARLV